MTERTIDIGQIEDAYAWDDEVWDPDTETYVPATYSDGTLMKGLRVDSIHINSDAAADTDAVRKSQMASSVSGAISDHVGESDPHTQYLLEAAFAYPFDIVTASPGDVLMLSDDSYWISKALMEPVTGVVNLSAIPDTLTGKDADTVDGIEGAALLKKDGTVALTGDWDIGSGRKIQAATIEGRNSSNLVLKYGGSDVKLTLSLTGLAFDGGSGDVLNFTTSGGLRLQGAIEAGQIKAFDSGGLKLADDSGTLGVFIEDGGEVGIGTNAPGYPLHVKKNVTNMMLIESQGSTARLFLRNSGGYCALVSLSSNDLVLATGSSPTEVLRCVNTGGLVGIGTSSPGGKLEIEVGSTAAVAALVLDQDDEDQPFIVFEGTSDTGLSKNITTDEDSGGVLTGPVLYVRVKVGSSTYWLPLYEP